MPSLVWDLPATFLASPSLINGAVQDPDGDEVWVLTQGGPTFGKYNMVTGAYTPLTPPGYTPGGSWGCLQLVKIGNHIWDFSSGGIGVIGRYDITNDAAGWVTGFSLAGLYSEPLVAALGTDVYLAGGEGAPALNFNVYDTLTDSYTTGLPALPTTAHTVRHAGAAVFVGEQFVAIGGRVYGPGSAQASGRVDVIDVSDLGAGWAVGPTLHTSLRSHSAIAMADGTIWVGPGHDQNGANATSKRTVNRITLPSSCCIVTGATNTNTCPGYDVGGGFPPVMPYPMREGAACGRCDSEGAFFIFGGVPWNGFDPDNAVQRFKGFDAISEGWGEII